MIWLTLATALFPMVLSSIAAILNCEAACEKCHQEDLDPDVQEVLCEMCQECYQNNAATRDHLQWRRADATTDLGKTYKFTSAPWQIKFPTPPHTQKGHEEGLEEWLTNMQEQIQSPIKKKRSESLEPEEYDGHHGEGTGMPPNPMMYCPPPPCQLPVCLPPPSPPCYFPTEERTRIKKLHKKQKKTPTIKKTTAKKTTTKKSTSYSTTTTTDSETSVEYEEKEEQYIGLSPSYPLPMMNPCFCPMMVGVCPCPMGPFPEGFKFKGSKKTTDKAVTVKGSEKTKSEAVTVKSAEKTTTTRTSSINVGLRAIDAALPPFFTATLTQRPISDKTKDMYVYVGVPKEAINKFL